MSSEFHGANIERRTLNIELSFYPQTSVLIAQFIQLNEVPSGGSTGVLCFCLHSLRIIALEKKTVLEIRQEAINLHEQFEGSCIYPDV